VLPLACLISCAACSVGMPSSPAPTPVCADPIRGIKVPPKLNDADRAEIVREMQIPGTDLLVRTLMDNSNVTDQVRRAQAVK
jgi:hypothetical protein